MRSFLIKIEKLGHTFIIVCGENVILASYFIKMEKYSTFGIVYILDSIFIKFEASLFHY